MSIHRIAIVADVPLGVLEGLACYAPPVSHYATWLEAVVPSFGSLVDFDIHWITFSKEVEIPMVHRSMAQTFHVLPRNRKLLSMVSGYFFETRQVTQLLKELKPDLVHAWGTEDVYGLAGARAPGSNKLFTLQGCLTECLKWEPSPSWLMRLQAAFERKTVCSYSVATGESAVSVTHLRSLHPAVEAHLVDYGVPNDFFEAEWNPSNVPNALYAGSVSAAKGVIDLVEVMSRPELKHVTLYVAGCGKAIDELRKRGMRNVQFLGRQSRTELIALMEQAWVLVAPTHADTGPSILKEARVVGLPVVTTTAAGASSYIADAGCGAVISPNDQNALTDEIVQLTRSREHALSVGKRGWIEHRAQLHSRVTAEKFAKIYKMILHSFMS